MEPGAFGSRVQEITNTVHPPGGATALLFEIVPMLHKFEFMYVESSDDEDDDE